MRRFASLFVGPVARGAAARSGTGNGLAWVPLWVPGAIFLPPSGVPFVPTFSRVCVCVSFPDGSEYALFFYKYADLRSLNRPIFSDTEACGVSAKGPKTMGARAWPSGYLCPRPTCVGGGTRFAQTVLAPKQGPGPGGRQDRDKGDDGISRVARTDREAAPCWAPHEWVFIGCLRAACTRFGSALRGWDTGAPVLCGDGAREGGSRFGAPCT